MYLWSHYLGGPGVQTQVCWVLELQGLSQVPPEAELESGSLPTSLMRWAIAQSWPAAGLRASVPPWQSAGT